jgi:hypothetical protein
MDRGKQEILSRLVDNLGYGAQSAKDAVSAISSKCKREACGKQLGKHCGAVGGGEDCSACVKQASNDSACPSDLGPIKSEWANFNKISKDAVSDGKPNITWLDEDSHWKSLTESFHKMSGLIDAANKKFDLSNSCYPPDSSLLKELTASCVLCKDPPPDNPQPDFMK